MWNEMNDLGEDNIVNNPKIETYPSFVFSNQIEKKRLSLSVSKENKNQNYKNDLLLPLKNNIFKNDDILLEENLKFKNIPEIKNIFNKIELKNKDIEIIKKKIEKGKNLIIKYENEIENIKNFMILEEQEVYNLQQMINFFIKE